MFYAVGNIVVGGVYLKIIATEIIHENRCLSLII